VKCRRQVDPQRYRSNVAAWRSIVRSEGVRGIFFGWSPTFVGYCLQGASKYGFYEVFKYVYGERLFAGASTSSGGGGGGGEAAGGISKTLVYLGASASAEFLADIALCPWEAIKVRMQTTLPPYARTLREGWRRIVQAEGYGG
jgi:solute carrier family 25 phosphate transporter 3